MNKTKTAFSGVLWSTITKLVSVSLKFVSVPLLLKYYGKDQYGLTVLALSLNVYLQLMDLGLNIGNIRFISNWISLKKPEEINKLTQSNIIFYGIIGLTNTIILILLGYFADRIFLVPTAAALTLSHLLYLLALTAFITWVGSVFKQIIYAYEKIAWDQRLTLISSIISFGAVLLAINLQLSLEYYFLLNILTIIFPVPFWLFKSKKLAPFLSFKPKWHSLVFRPILVYSIAIFAMGIFQFSVQNLRPIILGMRCNVTYVTDFSIIQQLAGLVMLVGGSFLTVLLPIVSKIKASGDQQTLKIVAYDATRYLSIFLSFVVFVFILISGKLLEVYVGKDYVHLSFWLNIWCLTLLANHNMAISSIVLSGSNLKPLTYCTAISTILSLTLAWFLAPIYNIGGVVISYLVYIIIMISFYYVYFIPKILNFDSLNIFFNSFLKPVFVGLSSLLASYFVMTITEFHKFGYIIISIFLFSTIYITLSLFFTVKIPEIQSLIKKII